MFRWLKRLLGKLNPRKKKTNEDSIENTNIHLDVPEEQKDIPLEQDISQEAGSNIETLNIEANSTVASETPVEPPLSEVIREIISTDTSDELSTIEHLVESLPSHDASYKDETSITQPIPVSTIRSFDAAEEVNSVSSAAIFEEQPQSIEENSIEEDNTHTIEPAPIIYSPESIISEMGTDSDDALNSIGRLESSLNPHNATPEEETISETQESTNSVSPLDDINTELPFPSSSIEKIMAAEAETTLQTNAESAGEDILNTSNQEFNNLNEETVNEDISDDNSKDSSDIIPKIEETHSDTLPDSSQQEDFEIRSNEINEPEVTLEKNELTTTPAESNEESIDVSVREAKEIEDNLEDTKAFPLSIENFEEKTDSTIISLNEAEEEGTDSSPDQALNIEDNIDTYLGLSQDSETQNEINETVSKSRQTTIINVDEVSTKYEKLNLDTDDFDSLMENLCFKVKSNKLIGYDVLQFINNEEIINKIHSAAEQYLIENYNRSSANTYVHKEDIVVSLILIALLKYDGSLWDYVRNQYSHLYSIKSKQKTDRMIRQILAEYVVDDSRYINFVVRHAIIPYNYLYDFITFAFDIYKGTLGYEIPEKLDYILANIYIDVSNSYESDSEQLQTTVKTYKLIKTTKDIIDNVQWFGELIAYTNLVLRYIDLHYWEDNKEPLPYSYYFDPVVEKWISNNKSLFYEERDYKSRERSSWSASFTIDQTDVILHVANCIIRKENDPSDISINILNGGIPYNVIRPKVTEEIGGYLVHGTNIRIANPIGELEYQICCGNKILYSTNDKLHRKYLLFNENHNEIKNTSQYYGNVDIVVPKDMCDGLQVYYSDPEYDFVIAQKYVDAFDSIKIGDEQIYFYAEEKTSLNAVKADGVIINSKHHSFDVYKKINYLTVITSEPPENLALQVNNNNYHWKDWLFKQTSNGYIYKIDLLEFVNKGFYEINILNWKDNNQTLYSDRFFLDPNYEVNFQQTSENTIRMNISSDIVSETVVLSDMNADHIFDIAFDHSVFSSTLHMIVTPGIPVYRIDNKSWNLFDVHILKKNLTNIYSRIYFDGIEPESIKLLSKNPERILNDILIQNIARNNFITIEKLLSAPENVPIASLAFYVDGIAIETIDIFYRAVFDPNSLETDYDADSNEGIIRFNILGNDQIHVTVFSKDKLFYRNDDVSIPAEIRVPNIDSFGKYNISITGGKNNLFELNNSKQYEILSQKISFYNSAGIINRSFAIDCCRLHYTLIQTDEGRDYIIYPHQSEIEVLKKLPSGKYEVSVKQILGGIEKSFVAEMEMTSTINSGDFWCSITYQGKWLEYDTSKSTPTNIHNDKYMDILEYHVYYIETEKRHNTNKSSISNSVPLADEKNRIVTVIPLDEKNFNNYLSIQSKGNPVTIGTYLYGTPDARSILSPLTGDALILKVNNKYYKCSLSTEGLRILCQPRNGLIRVRISAKCVYDFFLTDEINGLPIVDLSEKYDLLFSGNLAGQRDELGYIYILKQ